MTKAVWPDIPVVPAPSIREVQDAEIMKLLEPVGALYAPAEIPSKSPTKYAVDYYLVDEDGNVMEDTDYFITKEETWERVRELYDLSDLQGQITFREL